MADFIRFFIPIYFIMFFAVSFLGVSIAVAKKIGKNPNVLPKGDSAYALVGWYFKLILAVLCIYAILPLLFPNIKEEFNIHILDADLFRSSGMGLMLLAFIWVVIAQLQMRDSWRIGIDEHMKTELITTGLFQYSRNPIFFGMTLSLTGFFFAFPTMIAFFLLIIGSILMQIQIRLEEEHLLRQHGSVYLTYKKRVGRMLSLY
ncbi:methyltransferase family protein [Chryseobacterium jejuense]|jgi:protein-S-isoprenylcysteine O-methyltransferase Ste14|uniref:methyltransferase family protein n=1 Tax=Chryseobacterium jejuense TaxID=445960 RepID=UPI001AE6A0B0|nr:isoprenylcysteine carboxylmethyltransferase family protein [Chryseobacterium jejuense]MBP2617532.1 protein-S-isoprenylcysteine O-methyltransferase Ste14 [Chryseobacterium jejuense]